MYNKPFVGLDFAPDPIGELKAGRWFGGGQSEEEKENQGKR